MAGKLPSVIENNLLQCPLCAKVFTSPRFLPCLHAFCEQCLISYLQSKLAKNEHNALDTEIPVQSYEECLRYVDMSDELSPVHVVTPDRKTPRLSKPPAPPLTPDPQDDEVVLAAKEVLGTVTETDETEVEIGESISHEGSVARAEVSVFVFNDVTIIKDKDTNNVTTTTDIVNSETNTVLMTSKTSTAGMNNKPNKTAPAKLNGETKNTTDGINNEINKTTTSVMYSETRKKLADIDKSTYKTTTETTETQITDRSVCNAKETNSNSKNSPGTTTIYPTAGKPAIPKKPSLMNINRNPLIVQPSTPPSASRDSTTRPPAQSVTPTVPNTDGTESNANAELSIIERPLTAVVSNLGVGTTITEQPEQLLIPLVPNTNGMVTTTIQPCSTEEPLTTTVPNMNNTGITAEAKGLGKSAQHEDDQDASEIGLVSGDASTTTEQTVDEKYKDQCHDNQQDTFTDTGIYETPVKSTIPCKLNTSMTSDTSVETSDSTVVSSSSNLSLDQTGKKKSKKPKKSGKHKTPSSDVPMLQPIIAEKRPKVLMPQQDTLYGFADIGGNVGGLSKPKEISYHEVKSTNNLPLPTRKQSSKSKNKTFKLFSGKEEKEKVEKHVDDTNKIPTTPSRISFKQLLPAVGKIKPLSLKLPKTVASNKMDEPLSPTIETLPLPPAPMKFEKILLEEHAPIQKSLSHDNLQVICDEVETIQRQGSLDSINHEYEDTEPTKTDHLNTMSYLLQAESLENIYEDYQSQPSHRREVQASEKVVAQVSKQDQKSVQFPPGTNISDKESKLQQPTHDTMSNDDSNTKSSILRCHTQDSLSEECHVYEIPVAGLQLSQKLMRKSNIDGDYSKYVTDDFETVLVKSSSNDNILNAVSLESQVKKYKPEAEQGSSSASGEDTTEVEPDFTEQVYCPICKVPIPVTNIGEIQSLPKATFLEKLVQIHQLQNETPVACTNCGVSENRVVAKCLDCVMNMCGQCMKAHQHFITERNHAVVTLQQLQSGKFQDDMQQRQYPRCLNHSGSPADFYCHDCPSAGSRSQLVCKECYISYHNHHSSQALGSLSERNQRFLESVTDRAEGIKGTYNTENLQLEKYWLQYDEERKKVTADITQQYGKVRSLLDEAYSGLITQIFYRYEDEFKYLMDLKNANLQALNTISNVNLLAEQLLKHGNPDDIVELTPHLALNLVELQDRKPAKLDSKLVIDFASKENGRLCPLDLLPMIGSTCRRYNPIKRQRRFQQRDSEHMFQKTAQTVELLQTFTPRSPTDDKGCKPTGIAINEINEIHILDDINRKIKVFSTQGLTIKEIKPKEKEHALVDPWDIAITRYGNLVITDRGARLVKVFDTEGEFVFSFGPHFGIPWGVCTNSQNDMIITDTEHHCTFIHDSNGELKYRCPPLRGHPVMKCPEYVACNPLNDDIAISDLERHAIYIFNSIGQFLMRLGRGSDGGFGFIKGPGINQFHHPCGVNYDKQGCLLVCDYENRRVSKWSSEGIFKTFILTPELHCINKPQTIAVLQNGAVVLADGNQIKIFGKAYMAAELLRASVKVDLFKTTKAYSECSPEESAEVKKTQLQKSVSLQLDGNASEQSQGISGPQVYRAESTNVTSRKYNQSIETDV